jgi:arylsulfatase A
VLAEIGIVMTTWLSWCLERVLAGNPLAYCCGKRHPSGGRLACLWPAGLLIGGALALCVSGGRVRAAEPGSRPNIVYILADDLGMGDVSCYNPDAAWQTIHMDRLAAEGLRFNDAHSGSAVCTPTRYGILTGRYAWRTRLARGVLDGTSGHLIDPGRMTVATFLRQHGYHTACIGKWHLGWQWPDTNGAATTQWKQIDFTQPVKGGPTDKGFDYYYGDDVPNWPPYVWIENDRLQGNPADTMKADSSNGVSTGPATPGWQLEKVLPTSNRFSFILR